jgi:hypothetical protein
MIPSLSEAFPADPSKNALVAVKPQATAASTSSSSKALGNFMLDDTALLSRVREAENLSGQYMQTSHRTAWERSYKAYRNEHFDGSKYLSEAFKSRSKIFRPKTRSSVRKNMAGAAEALFSTIDPVTITAQDEGNPQQVASAAIKSELLSMRLTRTGRAGIPWFLISMGARQDSMLTGVCVSKQYWKFEEKTVGMEIGPLGVAQPKKKRVWDRPDVILFPPENVLIDPTANWVNPAQHAAYLILRYPMQVSDVIKMTIANPRDTTPWLPVAEDELRGYAVSPIDAQATRRAREGGQDTKDRTTTGQTFGIVWVYEVFMHINGEDYTFWTVDARRLLSRPKLTEDVWPCFYGDRPVVIGYGSVDAHSPMPMAPAESWQQLQQEANDLANLRLDHMKQVVSPITKVKRGRQVDLQAIQKRGPNSVVLLKDMEDIEFDRPQDVPPSAHTESQYINNDFDDLAGSFNQSSVQGNRQLNETVGGMKLLAGGANSMSEFDLRVWTETWTEPVMAQLVKLEEYYEDDATLLAVAGERAQLFQKFDLNVVTEEMLKEESTVRVNVGTGAAASDPMQKLQKFALASKTITEMLTPFVEAGVAKPPIPDVHAITTEVYGAAGYKDGGDRFFKNPDDPKRANEPPPPPPPPDPKVLEAQQKAKQMAEAHAHDEQLKEQAHQQKMAAAQKEDQRAIEKADLEKDLQQHQAMVRATQREQELENAKQQGIAQRQEEQIKIAAARDLARVKAEEARVHYAAVKDAADLKKREADLTRADLEVKHLELEVKRQKLEVEAQSLEVQRQELESRKRQISMAEETAKVKAEEAKSTAKAKTAAAKAKPAAKASK